MTAQVLVLLVAATPSARDERAADSRPTTPAVAPATVCDPNAEPPLRTVVAGNAPFVVADEEGRLSGISIELWTEVAKNLCRRFEVQRTANVNAAIDRVTSGRGDVIVAPASITAARSQRVAFSQPYFNAGLAILAPAKGDTIDRVLPFLTNAFATGIGVLLGVLTLVGTIIWLAERKRNPEEFPRGPVAGIGNGIWLALVTMTSVGYGDRVPKTVTGRFVAGVWMLVSILFVSSLTASMATAFTLSQLGSAAIGTAGDLGDRLVGVPKGTTSVRFSEGAGARVVPMENVDSAVTALAAGEVEAVVFDRPALKYLARKNPEWDLQLSVATYQPQGYGFAVPLGSPLLHRINVALLTLAESGETGNIKMRWLGEDE